MQRQHAPYRADVVGSFLRPDAIKQARLKFASGEIDAGQLRAVEDEAIRHVVEQQCACGLHVVTDGEFRRAWWHFDFFDGLQGVERYDSQQGIQFNGVQTKAHGVRVTGKLGFGDHPMLEDFRYLKSISGNAQPKMTIPSPSVLHFRGGRKDIDATVYPDLNDYFDDLATTWRDAIRPSTTRAAVICSWMTPSGPISVRTISAVRSASAAMMPMSWRASMPAC
jgi:5-methyltetrahydropteroyltriglutamate--homocysteine methyltransferase